MIKGLLNKQSELYAKAHKKEQEIEKAEKLKKRYEERAQWLTALIKPLAKAIQEKEGFFKFDTAGPFGITAETSIWFWKTEEDYQIYSDRNHPEHDTWTKRMFSVTFRPHSDYEFGEPYKMALHVVNRNENTGECPEGSIGALNGCNHPEIDITDWTLEQLIEFMYQQNEN